MLTPFEIEALRLSLQVALVASVLAFPFALGAALLLVRCAFPGKLLFEGLVYLPLILPPVAMGYILLLLFGRQGVIGAWLAETLGVSFAFSWQGAALAAALVGFPLFVRSIRLSLESVDRDLETAAAVLQAGRLRIFRTITWPLILPGVITGFVLAFGKALGEFGATITFVANIPGETQTIPLALFETLQTPGGGASATRLLVLSVLLAGAALAASELFARALKRRSEGRS